MTRSKLNQGFAKLASNKTIAKTVKALEKNGIKAIVVENGSGAKKKVLEILPQKAEVMTMTSVTLDTTGISSEINESGNYNSVRAKLVSMDRNTQGLKMQKMGAAPAWAIGSVHAVTEKGEVLIASNSGSQLPAYAYGSAHVIWVVGTQKIVKDTEEGLRRIYEYSYPLEDERAQKAYGMRSGVNKILIINKEVIPDRIRVILIKENLGF